MLKKDGIRRLEGRSKSN